jgi:uncharacterized UBP type Zn finger protein
MSSSDPPPPPAAAAAAQDDDATLAKKWAALDQLTDAYGFSMEASKKAIDNVGPDIPAACAFLIDNGLGVDKGGPVFPIDSCPHMDGHVKISPRDLDSFDPSSSRCSHFEDSEQESSGKGKAKADVDSATGSCTSTENWMCLECGVVRCSRYANGHGLVHWENTKAQSSRAAGQTSSVGHCVQLSLSDLSVWCHVCAAYLHHATLSEILKKVEERKFAEHVKEDAPGGKAAE